MGCTSSKQLETVLKAEGLERYSKSLSMRKKNTSRKGSSHKHEHLHHVALTSSTYGIFNPETFESEQQEHRTQKRGKSFDSSTNQVYEKLKNFESELEPESWSEVSKVLDSLKPALEDNNKKNRNGRNAVEELGQPGNVIVGETIKSFDSNSITFHTVEELDAKVGRSKEKTSLGRIERRANCIEVGSSREYTQKSSVENPGKLVPPGRNVVGCADLGSRQSSDKNLQGPNSDLNERGNEISRASNSALIDNELLASFENTLKNLSEDDWNAVRNKESDEEKGTQKPSSPMVPVPINAIADFAGKGSPYRVVEAQRNPLEIFEEKCPPGGEKAVVLYTTTLRGIRKTFEDCNKVRSVLESFGVPINERDVSMDLKFRNELKELMGKPVPVPRLFIKGRYIGGAEEALQLNDDGKLDELLSGLSTGTAGKVCQGCGGMRFVPCLQCSGSCKLINDENIVVRCPHCNENGLIQCPMCW